MTSSQPITLTDAPEPGGPLTFDFTDSRGVTREITMSSMPSGVEFFQLAALKGALSLELQGLTRRGATAASIARRQFGLPARYPLADCHALLVLTVERVQARRAELVELARLPLTGRALYLGDNGRCLCADHLGHTARTTGHDLSGQPLHRVTAEERAAESLAGAPMRCELCRRNAAAALGQQQREG